MQRISIDNIPIACMLGGAEGRTLFITTTESLDPNNVAAKGRIEVMPVEAEAAGWP